MQELKKKFRVERERILTGSSSQLCVVVGLLEAMLVLEAEDVGCTCDCFKASNLNWSFFMG